MRLPPRRNGLLALATVLMLVWAWMPATIGSATDQAADLGQGDGRSSGSSTSQRSAKQTPKFVPAVKPAVIPSHGGGHIGPAGGPANDTFASEVVLALPGTPTGDTTGSSVQAGEPLANCAPSPGATIWYRITPASSGTLRLNTVGSAYDTTLAVFTGATLATLTQIACNDDDPGTGLLTSRLSVSVVAGTVYHVQLGGAHGDSGPFSLQATLSVPPANDAFLSAAALVVPSTVNGDTTGATMQAAEPIPACGPTIGATVWYRVSVSANGNLIATALQNPAGNGFDPILALYQGVLITGLTPLACADDLPNGTPTARVSAAVVAGQTYYLQLGGFGADAGAFSLQVSLVPPPANDAFAGATLVAVPSTTSGDNSNASVELGEPVPTCTPTRGATLWYRVVPATNGALIATTAGAAFDTMLALYRGPTLPTLTQVACNDDGPGGEQLTSRLVGNVVFGETYFLQVGGFNGDTGTFSLQLSLVPPPSNDAFANAAALAIPGAASGDSTGATLEAGEGVASCNLTTGATLWYRLTPGVSGILDVSTAGSAFDTTLALYTGATLASLVGVACNDDETPSPVVHSSRLTASVTAGTNYYLQLGGAGGAVGPFSLTAAIAPPSPTVTPSLTPTRTPTPTSTPLPVGGRGFSLRAGAPGTAEMSWTDGAVETGYLFIRYGPVNGIVFLPPGLAALGPTATTYTDSSASGEFAFCYLLLPIGGNPPTINNLLGFSDFLCFYTTPGVGTFAGNFQVQLNQSQTATLTWTPAAGATGYRLRANTFDGQPDQVTSLAATLITTTHATAGKSTCNVHDTLSGASIIGTSNKVCAVPGLSRV